VTHNYFETRFPLDINRARAWKYLTKFFQKYIEVDAHVLEIGAGYCYFINGIKGAKKIAVDIFPDLGEYAANNVDVEIRNAVDLSFLGNNSLDVVFASNFLEHLTQEELHSVMCELKRVVKVSGKVLIMQPNYKYAFASYFDDYTHRSVFSHISLRDWFASNGFNAEVEIARFLPLTVKSKAGWLAFLIPIYLRSPWKPRAGQMFFVFRKLE
jgi:ubiquinone/menaquinone biosynthesis C-methylase UbiE